MVGRPAPPRLNIYSAAAMLVVWLLGVLTRKRNGTIRGAEGAQWQFSFL